MTDETRKSTTSTAQTQGAADATAPGKGHDQIQPCKTGGLIMNTIITSKVQFEDLELTVIHKDGER